MRLYFSNSVILVLIATIISSCSSSVTSSDQLRVDVRELNVVEQQLVEADQSFSHELFRSIIAEDDKDNVLISPLSISFALGMALNGAEGETFKEMQEALGFTSLNLQEINEGYESLMQLLNGIDPNVVMNIANSAWLKENTINLNEEYVERIKTHFDADFTELDFNDPEAAGIINDWVNKKTNGKIEELVGEKNPPNLVLLLVNALVFEADWTDPFDPELTDKANFHLENGGSTEVDMMERRAVYASLFNKNIKMLDIPYGDSLFTMTVLIPTDKSIPLEEFIQDSVTRENLNVWTNNLSGQRVDLRLPRFELKYEIQLNEILELMDMNKAFKENEANFTGMLADSSSSPKRLFIDEIKHKTFIQVDEEGTEVAAATSVGLVPTSAAPPQMIVDRPFVFIIRERTSGANLFMGMVKNPNR